MLNENFTLTGGNCTPPVDDDGTAGLELDETGAGVEDDELLDRTLDEDDGELVACAVLDELEELDELETTGLELLEELLLDGAAVLDGTVELDTIGELEELLDGELVGTAVLDEGTAELDEDETTGLEDELDGAAVLDEAAELELELGATPVDEEDDDSGRGTGTTSRL